MRFSTSPRDIFLCSRSAFNLSAMIMLKSDYE